MTHNDIITRYLPAYAQTAKKHGRQFLVPVNAEELKDVCKTLYYTHKLPLKTMTATDNRAAEKSFKIYYVFGVPKESAFITLVLTLNGTTEFPSLMSEINEVWGYERKIHSFFGLKPVGHPDLRSMILNEGWPAGEYPLRKDFPWNKQLKLAHTPYPFFKVGGEGVYAITVGPVHAGIIEPGHFQFSVAGEEIIKLEAQLGYVHKGVEKLFEALPDEKRVALAERVSGDSSFNHALAYCQAIEELTGTHVPERAKAIRVVCAEMERVANHLNDIGFIMLDTAFTFGGSQLARLREIVMQANAHLSGGSRYFRGMNQVGGLTKDVSEDVLHEILGILKRVQRELDDVIEIADQNDILLDRLQRTGKITKELVEDFGGVGLAARALGYPKDARVEYPYELYDRLTFNVVTEETGDVNARFRIRVREVEESIHLIKQAVEFAKYHPGPVSTERGAMPKNGYAIGITEGWKGDIVYFVTTDAAGQIASVHVRDASFLNWPLVTFAVLGNIVPDFPLINKSFNMSYSGNDV